MKIYRSSEDIPEDVKGSKNIHDLLRQMRTALEYCRDAAASVDIEEVTKEYHQRIEIEINEEKSKNRHVETLLKLAKKEGCSNAKAVIKSTLWGAENQESITIPSIVFYAHDAFSKLNFLKIKDGNQVQAFNKKILKLQKALVDVKKLYEDREIQNLINYMTGDDQPTEVEQIKGFENQIKKQLARLHLFLQNSKAEKGRPSIREFYECVYQLVCLYEHVSGRKFTIDRHKEIGTSGKGTYAPITDGHRFVVRGLEVLSEYVDLEAEGSAYTDKNIYNACEKAQLRLKKEAR